MENYIFKDVKVGDRLYSLRHGEVKVSRIIESPDDSYPLEVFDEKGNDYSYAMNGYFEKNDLNRDLYWTKPEIIEKPRIVTVEEDVWINKNFIDTNDQRLFRTKESGDTIIPAKLIYKIEK